MNEARACLYFVAAFLSACFLATAAPAAAPAINQPANRVLGRYWLPDHDGQFEIYVKNERYFGRIVAYDIAGQLDANNADAALRSRPFLGIDMFSDFQFDTGERKWIGGTIYDGSNGKTYDCSMWFDEDKPDVLVARGFIGFSFLGRNTRFDRVVPK